MTAPLSRDLRERIVRAVADGSSIRQAAERFQVSSSAAIKLMSTGGSLPRGCYKLGRWREAAGGGGS